MGCIPPQSGFLEGLRALCDAHQAILIFDEVMTGFRLARGGVQELYGVNADIVCFGKVIGGGLPAQAKKQIMRECGIHVVESTVTMLIDSDFEFSGPLVARSKDHYSLRQ